MSINVRIVENEIRCTICGAASTALGASLADMAANWKRFEEQHADCEPSDEASCSCGATDHDDENHIAVATTRPEDWLDCDDVGSSSKDLWRHMMGIPMSHACYPHDPDDFGRCYRLLTAPWAKPWRMRLWEMGKYGPAWAALAGAWEELEALYVEELPTGEGPKLFDRMKALGC